MEAIKKTIVYKNPSRQDILDFNEKRNLYDDDGFVIYEIKTELHDFVGGNEDRLTVTYIKPNENG